MMSAYERLPWMLSKETDNLVPILLTPVIIDIPSNADSRPYSIAVAPLWLSQQVRNARFIMPVRFPQRASVGCGTVKRDIRLR